ncbi:hypothetical protein [Polymorphum gilvum]|nr:hypothetical protein [Polymorphum gilvum]
MARAASSRSALRIAASVAILFGILTLVSGGTALFGAPAARARFGDTVAFVLWFNFLAGFAYVAAGIGLFRRRRWSAWLSVAIAVATIAVFAAFGLHVAGGGAFEPRTVAALFLRTAVWLMIAATAIRTLGWR